MGNTEVSETEGLSNPEADSPYPLLDALAEPFQEQLMALWETSEDLPPTNEAATTETVTIAGTHNRAMRRHMGTLPVADQLTSHWMLYRRHAAEIEAETGARVAYPLTDLSPSPVFGNFKDIDYESTTVTYLRALATARQSVLPAIAQAQSQNPELNREIVNFVLGLSHLDQKNRFGLSTLLIQDYLDEEMGAGIIRTAQNSIKPSDWPMVLPQYLDSVQNESRRWPRQHEIVEFFAEGAGGLRDPAVITERVLGAWALAPEALLDGAESYGRQLALFVLEAVKDRLREVSRDTYCEHYPLVPAIQLQRLEALIRQEHDKMVSATSRPRPLPPAGPGKGRRFRRSYVVAMQTDTPSPETAPAPALNPLYLVTRGAGGYQLVEADGTEPDDNAVRKLVNEYHRKHQRNNQIKARLWRAINSLLLPEEEVDYRYGRRKNVQPANQKIIIDGRELDVLETRLTPPVHGKKNSLLHNTRVKFVNVPNGGIGILDIYEAAED